MLINTSRITYFNYILSDSFSFTDFDGDLKLLLKLVGLLNPLNLNIEDNL